MRKKRRYFNIEQFFLEGQDAHYQAVVPHSNQIVLYFYHFFLKT
jgi:hypothetical protein